MGESYSKLNTAPLIGSIIKKLMSTDYFNNKERPNNITIKIEQESYCQKCVNKIQERNKLVPIIEFL